jgi:hypothetical protein
MARRCRRRPSLGNRCLAGRNELRLVLAIAKRPVASTRADDIQLLEQRALVPVLADLDNFLVLVEADDVDLRRS